MKEISVQEVKKWRDNKKDFQLIDVRESYENELSNIGGELIPMDDVPQECQRIATDKPVVIHCRSGHRSANAIQWLESKYGYDNLYNMTGGIIAWKNEIDPSLQLD